MIAKRWRTLGGGYDAAMPTSTDPAREHRALPRWRSLATVGWPMLVFAAVLAIAAVHYQGQTLARGPDQADVLLALFHDASHAIAEEGPLAAMYSGGVRAGESNWSNPNYHVLYPLYFNWAGADASPEATLDRLNRIIVLHLALLGAGGFVLARALGVRTPIALAVGLVLPWFPAVRAVAGWPHIIAGTAWLPWIFAAQARLHAGGPWRGQLAAALGLALAATLLVHAHPAQTLVFAACASGLAWLLVAAQAALRRDRRGLRALAQATGWLALAAVLVLAATWHYLAEVLAFHARAVRWLGEVGGAVVGNAPLPVEALRHHALDAAGWPRLFAFEYRRGVGNAYVGAAVLVAALALLGRHVPDASRARFARALAACGVVALAFCFAPLAPVVASLPLAGRVREAIWWSALAVVLLLPAAALGLQSLRLRSVPPLVRDPWAWAAAAGLALALVAAVALPTGHRPATVASTVLAFAGLAWCLRARRALPAAAAAAAVLVLAATVWTPFHHNVRFARDDAMLFHPDRVQARADAAALAARLPGRDRYRLALGASVPDAQLLVHAWTLHGFRSTQGGIGPMDHGKHRLLAEGGPALSALYGVRWTVWPEADARPGDAPLRPGLVLRTDPAALPRVFALAGGLETSVDPVATLLASDARSPLRAVVQPTALPPGVDAGDFGGPARLADCLVVERAARTAVEVRLDCPHPVLLVLNEDPAARWRATVDGTAAPVFAVNGYQAAVAIRAPGPHAVRIARPARLGGRGDLAH